MLETAAMGSAEVVDTARYPLLEPGDRKWQEVVSGIRAELRRDGCCVLPDFIRADLLETLRHEGAQIAPDAYYTVETVNAYNIPLDADLPARHPGRRRLQRGNAFVPRDRIPAQAVIQRLYGDPVFRRFVADCFGLPDVHELGVVRPGMQHPWHFDTNEFTVSLLTQEAQAGGVFEYCPNIRSATDENFAAVAEVLDGNGTPRRLTLRPGDLQLFKGRFSLHRVTTVDGEVERHTAIFAYSERPGVVGSVARTRQLFGRVLPEHLAAETARVRGDRLLD